jgi:hypothetical protein
MRSTLVRAPLHLHPTLKYPNIILYCKQHVALQYSIQFLGHVDFCHRGFRLSQFRTCYRAALFSVRLRVIHLVFNEY